MKITIAGTGYVGLSNAILLAQNNEVIALDIIKEKVDTFNNKKSPIADPEIEEYLATKDLNLTATTDNFEAFKDAMKILNINSYYYTSTVHKQLQLSLSNRGIKTFTYVPVSKQFHEREECKYKEEQNVKKVACYNKFDRYVFHVKHRKIFKNIVEEVDFNMHDCMHAHSLFSNGYIAMKLKATYGLPYVVAVRDTDINVFFKKMYHLRKLGNEILQEADKVIFLSESYKDKLINTFVKPKNRELISAKSYVIPSGIDEYWLNNVNSIKQLNSDKAIKLLHVGEISKRKNILTTVKSIELLKKNGYDVQFTLVGKIVDNHIYESIKKLDFIKYISPKPQNDLLEIYRENDIFVMPSITETFGLVYPEAMSQGLPIIYTRGQGFDGQLEDGKVGYSVDCNNPEEILSKIINILDNYEEFSRNCIDNIDKFRWKNITKQYKNIYENID